MKTLDILQLRKPVCQYSSEVFSLLLHDIVGQGHSGILLELHRKIRSRKEHCFGQSLVGVFLRRSFSTLSV